LKTTTAKIKFSPSNVEIQQWKKGLEGCDLSEVAKCRDIQLVTRPKHFLTQHPIDHKNTHTHYREILRTSSIKCNEPMFNFRFALKAKKKECSRNIGARVLGRGAGNDSTLRKKNTIHVVLRTFTLEFVFFFF
jgi:hypothetical protein